MNRVEQMYRNAPQPASFARAYLDYVSEILGKLDADAVAFSPFNDAAKRNLFILGQDQ